MKIFKEIQDQYLYVWWWLVNQGLFVATLLVNTLLLSVFTAVMIGLYFFIKWFSKH